MLPVLAGTSNRDLLAVNLSVNGVRKRPLKLASWSLDSDTAPCGDSDFDLWGD